MIYIVTTYILYLAISVALTVWVSLPHVAQKRMPLSSSMPFTGTSLWLTRSTTCSSSDSV